MTNVNGGVKKNIVGANSSKVNKKRSICVNPDSPSNCDFYVHVPGNKGGWDFIVDFWTYDDFECKSFKEKNGN